MPQRVLRLLLFVLSLSCPAQAQQSVLPSRIAAAQTDAQVLELIRPLGWEYKEAVLGDSAVRAYQAYAGTRFAVLGGSTWFKADFDGNGYPDLLVLARRQDIPLVFCVLDSGNNRLRVVRNFYDSGSRRLPNARVVYRRGQALLRYTDFAEQRSGKGKPRQLRTRLLAYQAGGFVPYNRRPSKHQIEAIDYRSFFAYHGITETKLYVNLRGVTHWKRNVKSFDSPPVETKEKLVAQLDSTAKTELAALLNYVRFERSPSRYKKSGGNHQPIVKLTVTYDGGRRKTIYDPNGDGNAGLAWLYNYLEQLRATQRWQDEK